MSLDRYLPAPWATEKATAKHLFQVAPRPMGWVDRVRLMAGRLVGAQSSAPLVGSRRHWNTRFDRPSLAAGVRAAEWGWDPLRPLPGTVAARRILDTWHSRCWVLDHTSGRTLWAPQTGGRYRRVIVLEEVWTGADWMVTSARHDPKTPVLHGESRRKRPWVNEMGSSFSREMEWTRDGGPLHLLAFANTATFAAVLVLWHPAPLVVQTVLRIIAAFEEQRPLPSPRGEERVHADAVLEVLLPQLRESHRVLLSLELRANQALLKSLLLSGNKSIREIVIRSVGYTRAAA